MNKKKYYNFLCACGCGKRVEIKPHHKWNGIPKYICGHQRRNKHHTEETKQKQRESKLGDKNPMKRPEVREKMIASCLGKAKPKLKKIIKELWIHEEYRRKQRESHTGKHPSEETKKKMRKSQTGKKRTNAAKKRYSRAAKRKWLNPEYRNKIIKAFNFKPTKPEILLDKLLQDLFPNQYKYVGDFQIVIGGKCPDFINETKHKIIELFGDYWHSEEITKRSRLNEEKSRIKHFSKYRYQTLIIWEYELKNIKLLKKKLMIFNSN